MKQYVCFNSRKMSTYIILQIDSVFNIFLGFYVQVLFSPLLFFCGRPKLVRRVF